MGKKKRHWAHPTNKAYRKLNIALNFLPAHIATRLVKCSVCGNQFTPRWSEKRRSTHPVHHKFLPLMAVPTGIQIKCNNPSCSRPVLITFPHNEKKGIAHTYVDEAYRHLSLQRCLTNYSSVSVRPKFLHQIEQRWGDLKNDLISEGLLDSNSFHVTELKDKDPKKCIEVLAITSQWVDQIRKELGEDVLRIYSSIAIGENKAPESKEMKRRAFEAYFIFTQQEATGGGIQHNYKIESDGKQGWVNEMLMEFFHTLAFPFICNGLEVPLVESVNKGDGLTELADMVAFVTVRHCADILEDKKIYFDSSCLGEVRYIMVKQNAHLCVSKGVPVDLLK